MMQSKLREYQLIQVLYCVPVLCMGMALFPAVSLAASITKTAGTVQNAATYGDNISWSNLSVESIGSNDGVYATATYTNGGQWTDALVAKNFGFDIPDGSTLDSIEVKINWFAPGGATVYAIWMNSLNGYISDYNPLPTSDGADVVYTDSAGAWGETEVMYTISDVENANFGVNVWPSGDNVGTVSVDQIQITINYTAPPTPTLSAGAQGECTVGTCPQDFGQCGSGVADANGTYNIDITFSQSVTGFTSGDITVTDNDPSASSTVQSFSGNGASYIATITSSCTDCLVEVSVGANVVDGGNTAAGPLYLPWGQNYDHFCDAQCGAVTLPDGYSLVRQDTEAVILPANEGGQVIDARIKKGTVRLTDVTLAFSPNYAACNLVTLGQENQQSLVHGLAPVLSAAGGSYALYVPKIASHTQLRVCSGKSTIGCTVSDNWSFLANDAGTITETRNEFDTTGITVAVADGYWKVSGLTGTSAEGEEGEEGGSSSSVPFFPLWALPIVLIGGVWVLRREGVLWR